MPLRRLFVLAFALACGDDSMGITCPDGEMVVDGICQRIRLDAGRCVPVDETCNGLDDDCDERIDEGVLTTFFLDIDEDGEGGEMTCDACAVDACGDGVWVDNDDDCDDDCVLCFTGGEETCDGLDNDCDRRVDEGDGLTTPLYRDQDEDGFGAGAIAMRICVGDDIPVGFAVVDGDCNDDNGDVPSSTFQSEAIPGVAGELGYDWNCDGVIERQSLPRCGARRCTAGIQDPTCSDDGLVACGELRDVWSCRPVIGSGHVAETTESPQRCR